MTNTEVHANFCEQQITVRKVLVLSDTVDTRLEKVCPSLPTMHFRSRVAFQILRENQLDKMYGAS